MPHSTEAPRVLITGGLGHIGSRLIRSLDYNMTVVDDLSTQRYCSLFDFKPSTERQIVFRPCSFECLDKDELSQYDVIVHLAAKTDAAASFTNRADVERVNVDQTLSLIDRASNAGVQLFVFPSSTSIYGVAKELIAEDDTGCINPQSPYAESKIIIENALHTGGMPYIIPRFGTIYGISPGMRFHTAVNKFCFQASIGEPLTIWKENYYQKRPYLDLTDAVASIKLLIGLVGTPGASNQVYNVTSGNHTVADVIRIIRKHIGVSLKLINTPLLNQYSYGVSCAKIVALGYTANGSLEEGIRLTLQQLSRIGRV